MAECSSVLTLLGFTQQRICVVNSKSHINSHPGIINIMPSIERHNLHINSRPDQV